MKIGWIGAGIMGSPMIMHLIDRQYEVHVYARHAEKSNRYWIKAPF